MDAVNLPPLPVLPASNADRALWVRWATQAVLDERERAARVCEDIEVEHWKRYKKGNGPERGSDYVQGQSDGANDCAAAIRKG